MRVWWLGNGENVTKKGKSFRLPPFVFRLNFYISIAKKEVLL